MPSKNPRLSVVLPPSVAATLAALSEETGESASSVVRGLLEQVEPALSRMLNLVRAAKQAQGKIGDGLAKTMDQVMHDLESATAAANWHTEKITADLVSQAEIVPGRRRSGSGRTGAARPARVDSLPPASTPGLVTRGSGPSTGARKASPRRVKVG